MIRFDMSEYQDIESLDRFLGSLRINEPGQLASHVRDNPFSIILLDEIEKAYKNILNIFLAVFDEGRMTDVFGRKVNFEQNIIIATSNAAAELIRDMVNQGLDPSVQKEKIIDALVGGHYFSPEFLNRFDEIVIFHPLSQEQLFKVAELLIGDLVDRIREQGYLFKPASEIIDYISKIGFDPQFGARPMQRAIQDKLETVIARKILDGTIRKGEEFSLAFEEVAT
jgi:ATP-dependent Clp protease ATP-binding subunit ClpA